jgi:hypothetical protein
MSDNSDDNENYSNEELLSAIDERDELIVKLYEKLGYKREYIQILENKCKTLEYILERDRLRAGGLGAWVLSWFQSWFH